MRRLVPVMQIATVSCAAIVHPELAAAPQRLAPWASLFSAEAQTSPIPRAAWRGPKDAMSAHCEKKKKKLLLSLGSSCRQKVSNVCDIPCSDTSEQHFQKATWSEWVLCFKSGVPKTCLWQSKIQYKSPNVRYFFFISYRITEKTLLYHFLWKKMNIMK